MNANFRNHNLAFAIGMATALLATVWTSSAWAVAYNWTETSGGDWTTEGFWDNAGNPDDATDTATFGTLSGPYTTTLNVGRTIGGLNMTSGATDPTLTINNTLNISGGTSNIDGGTLNGTGTLIFTNSATVNWSAPAAGGTLSYLVPSLNPSSHTVAINNTAGTFAVGTGQTLQVGSTATLNTAQANFLNGFTNDGEIRIGVKQPPNGDFYGKFHLNIATGTIVNSSGANINLYARSKTSTSYNTREVNSSLQNAGTVSIYTTDGFLGGTGKTVTNTGTIATDHSNYASASNVPKVTINGSMFTNSGTLDVGANHGGLGGGYMIIRNSTINLNTGSNITGPGTLELGGNTVNINTGTTFTGLTTLAFGQKGNVATAVNWNISDLTDPINFKIVSAGDVTMNRSTDWVLPSNQVLWMDAVGGATEPMTFTMAKNLTNNGEVRMGRAPDAGSNYAQQNLILTGTNTFTNNASGVVNMYVRKDDDNNSYDERYISANIQNDGEINAYSSRSRLGTAGKTIVNAGTINVDSSEYIGGRTAFLELQGDTFTNTGNIDLNNARLAIRSTNFNYNSGSITTNAGSEIQLGNTNFTFGGGAEITTPVIYRVLGDSQATMTRSSTWNILSNQGLRFDVAGSTTPTSLTSNQDISNSGVILLGDPNPVTDVFLNQSLTINSANSRMTNNAGAEIAMYPRCADCGQKTNDNPWSYRRLEAELVNNGEFSIHTRHGYLGKASVNHVNNGTIVFDKNYYDQGTTGFSPNLTVTGSSLLNGATGMIEGNGTLDVQATTFNNAGTLSPGASAGLLTIDGDVNFLSGGNVYIEITGEGDVVGVDYDQLIVTGDVNGLSQADLVVNIDSLDFDLLGDVFTIMTAANDLSALEFNSVTFTGPAGFRGDVRYGNGFIKISNLEVIPAPEPSTGCLLLFGLLALRYRKRKRVMA